MTFDRMGLLVAAGLMAAIAHAAAFTSRGGPELQDMPVTSQNALVQKYCANCHTDAKRIGGVSFEQFNAETVAPSLAAMMLSKVRSGAMGAAAIPMPDTATVDAFAAALAVESKGAENWMIESNGAVTTATVLRQLQAPSKPGGLSLFRLALRCDAASGRGEMQLSWSPLPIKATLTVQIGTKPFTFNVDGADFRDLPRLVSEQIVVSGLFPGETVQFSFDGLLKPARRQLAPCFRD